MLRFAERKVLVRILLCTSFFTTLIVSPKFSYDPINVPKLATITIGAFLSLGVLISTLNRAWLVVFRSQFILIGLFIADLTFVLIFAGNNSYQEFFGTSGRATGYVAYTCLAILMTSSLIASGADLIMQLGFAVLIAGSLSIFYGVLQSLNIEPLNWSNQYSPVIGFLGNPNFQSSFVAFSSLIAFSYLIKKTQKAWLRISLLIYLSFAGYVISETHSQQGFIILAGGVGIIFLIWVKSSNFSRLAIPLTLASSVGLLIFILGMLNKGPFASILHKPSVTYRGDYWRAGWNMTLEHPFLGVGLDSYGDWYRRTRTIEATLRRGPEITSNAAHNVLLDLSSNGGFPLVFIYLLFTGLVIRSIVRLLKRSSSFDAPLAGLIAMWFAYQSQSIISLNQLGLAVWGWIISGALIGYEINTRNVDEISANPASRKKQGSARQIAASKVEPRTLLSMFGFLVIGVLVGLPPLVASTNYLSALKSQDAKKLEQAANIWPDDATRNVQVAILLANQGYQNESLKILQDSNNRFPDEYQFWRLILEIPISTPEQKAEALTQMKRLDPHNPDLK